VACESAKDGDVSAVGVLSGLLGSGLWAVLIWAVYFGLPRFRRIVDDFGQEISPLTVMVVQYAGLALPVFIAAAGVSFATKHSRRVSGFLFLWVPLLLLAGLVLTVGPTVIKLLNDLS